MTRIRTLIGLSPLLLILLASPESLRGQELSDTTLITVTGTVVDAVTGAPLRGAVVRVPELRLTSITEASGAFRVPDVARGVYRMVVSRMGYEEADGELEVERPGSFTVALAPLSRSPAGEPGVIVGRVLDDETGEPIRSVAVSLPGRDEVRLTDSAGLFRFGEVTPGAHLLRIENLGYQTVTDSILLAEGELLDVEVRMGVDPILLEGITVLARPRWLVASGFYRRQGRKYEGRQWTREEIEEMDPVFIQDLITTAPGIFYAGSRGGLRGRHRCRLSLYVDDFHMPGFSLDLIEPRHIEALEVYHGTDMPPEYKWKHCGVILVWLKH